MKCPLPIEEAKQTQTQRNVNAAKTSVPVSPYAADFSEERQNQMGSVPFQLSPKLKQRRLKRPRLSAKRFAVAAPC